MIRDITIGQYYPAQSPIHSMDARLKLAITFIFIVSLFIVNSFVGYAFVIACMALVIKTSKVPLKFMLKGLKSIMIIILFTVFINLFLTRGETVLLHVGFITVTLEGVLLAAKMCIRLVLLIVGSSILTLTTTPIQLTDAIEYILKPFKKIGVPAHEIAMMMTIALRFIPTLLDETDKIMKAQQARGADFDEHADSIEYHRQLDLADTVEHTAYRCDDRSKDGRDTHQCEDVSADLDDILTRVNKAHNRVCKHA